MTKCSLRQTCFLGLAAVLFASLVACGENRDNNGVIKKPKDAGDEIDTGIVMNPGDTGVPPNTDGGMPGTDTGVPPGNDSGMPPPPDGGMPGNDSGMPPFDGGMQMGDPFVPTMLADQYATAICAFQTRCEPAVQAFTGKNEATCRSETTAQLLNFWPAFAEAINAGRAAFRQTGFDACIQAYNNSDCITAIPANACEGMFVGNRPEGVACGASIECGNNLWCALQQLGGCGTCMSKAAATQSCANTICETGADCFNVNNMPVCARIDVAENQECGTVQSGLCQGHLQCVGPMAGPFTCERPAAANAACDATGAAPDCNIYQNLVCATPGNTCQMATFNGVGLMCGNTALCDVNGGCDMMTMTCVAWPDAGSACPDGVCSEGNFCDQAGNCQMITPQGQACTTTAQCGDLYCVNTTCGPLDWMQCN